MTTRVQPGGQDPARSPVSLPSRTRTPLRSVTARAALAAGLLVFTTVIVYAERSGYTDAVRPGQPIDLLGAFYYSAVTLSTTGYGDIVPVTAAARLVNVVVITPVRVIFLIVLIGTTLQVLAERTRTNWRLSRWRSRMHGHTVVVGYGTKGRSAVSTLREAGLPSAAIAVVDLQPQAVAEANRAGLAGVTGDATRLEVLSAAEVRAAARVVIAVGRDDAAVLIALTARQLSSAVVIIAAVRETENEPLLRQCGATEVVVSAATAGRLLGMAAVEPGAGQVMSDLLDRGGEPDLTERPLRPSGRSTPGSGSCRRRPPRRTPGQRS